MIKQEWIEKGYINEAIPEGVDLKAEIRRLCEEKNAVVLAHYYTDGTIQDVADFVGDSLALAQIAEKTTADILVMCGVHFMAETNKILSPEKKVLIPDLNAGCSLAESCPADELAKFKALHPGQGGGIRQYIGGSEGADRHCGYIDQRACYCRELPQGREDYICPR